MKRHEASLKWVGILVLGLILAWAPKSEAFCVPTFRVDNYLEAAQQQIELQLQQIMTNVIYTVTGIRSIDDLINLPSRFENLAKGFDMEGLLGDAAGSLMNSGMSDLTTMFRNGLTMPGFDMGDFSGSVAANGINGAVGDLMGSLRSAVRAATSTVSGSTTGEFGKTAKEVEGMGWAKQSTIGEYGGKAPTSAEAMGLASKMLSDYTDTYPLSLPGAQQTVGSLFARTGKTEAERAAMIIAAGDQAKGPIVAGIAQDMAPYVRPENDLSAFEKRLEQMIKNNESLLKKAGDDLGGLDSAGNAEKVIATILATQSQQIALQNNMLLTINQALADEIRIMGNLGYIQVEGYAANIRTGIDQNVQAIRRNIGSVTR